MIGHLMFWFLMDKVAAAARRKGLLPLWLERRGRAGKSPRMTMSGSPAKG
jgi:hypothetical protein